MQMYNLNQTSFYQSILETIKQRSKIIDDIDEAEDLAWEDRRMALKWFIKANSETLEEYLFGAEEEDDESWKLELDSNLVKLGIFNAVTCIIGNVL